MESRSQINAIGTTWDRTPVAPGLWSPLDGSFIADQHRTDKCGQRLAEIPGVGPVGASLLMMKTPDPGIFKSGRDFAAWIGLTPKDHSTASKVRLGVITRAGDEMPRSVLVVGATASLQHIRARRSRHASRWLAELLQRKKPKPVALALANKIARVAWKLMVSGETYRRTEMQMQAISW
jgi:transposase